LTAFPRATDRCWTLEQRLHTFTDSLHLLLPNVFMG